LKSVILGVSCALQAQVRAETIKLQQILERRPVLIVLVLMAVYAAYFSYYTILKHYAFQSYAFDLGIFMQYMWSTVQGEAVLYASILESPCFAWHFQPVLFLIVPLYGLFPHAETLLVLQSVVLALGALPVYWLARDELGARVGVVFAGLYLLYPALHGVNSFDFHPVALAIPILLFCFYAFKTKRYGWGMALAVLAMMCKENVSLVIVFMGLYWWLWVEMRKGLARLELRSLPKQREVLYPLCMSVVGAIWLLLAINVVIPHFSLSGEYPWFHRYGTTGILGNLPADAIHKLWYLDYLFAPLLFVPLLSPPTLLIGLPVFAQNLLAVDANMYSIGFQYSSLLIPWLFLASIYGAKYLSTVQGKVVDAIRNRLLQILVVSTIVMTLLVSPSPVALGREMPSMTQHHTILRTAIELIPEDASVYTQNDVFPHVCHRMHAYAHIIVRPPDFFEFYDGNYDYVLADSTLAQSILKWGSQASLERLEREYGVYAEGDGVYLYKRGYEGEPLKLGVAAEHKCAE